MIQEEIKEILNIFIKQASLFLFPVVGAFVGAAYSYLFDLEVLDSYNAVILFSLFGAVWAFVILVSRIFCGKK